MLNLTFLTYGFRWIPSSVNFRPISLSYMDVSLSLKEMFYVNTMFPFVHIISYAYNVECHVWSLIHMAYGWTSFMCITISTILTASHKSNSNLFPFIYNVFKRVVHWILRPTNFHWAVAMKRYSYFKTLNYPFKSIELNDFCELFLIETEHKI